MAVNFPNTPSLNEEFSAGDRTWLWNGTYWEAISTTIGYTGSAGAGFTGSAGSFTGTTAEIVNITNITASTSTETGALVVAGGVGVGGDLQVGGQLYANGQQVLTTATVNQYASQTSITAGTDTAVSTSTGNIVIWNTSTLQSVTDRGNITTNSIRIDNTLSSTSSFSSNALYVAGGIGGNSGFNINGDGYLQGNLNVTGYITGTNVTLNILSANSATFYGDETGSGALYAGVAGHTPFAQTMIQATGDNNSYMEINVQNINSGNQATTDVVASADNVSETGAYIDMGITSSGWDGTQPESFSNNLGPNDGYLMVGHSNLPTAGHLVIGTLAEETSVKIVVAGTNSNYVTAVFNTATTQSISTTTGALVVRGGMGVGGAINVASTSYINGSKILTAGDLETVTTTATYITNNPALVAVAGTSTTYGTYNFGGVTDIQTFNDYNTGTNTGFYSINDASGAPGYIVYVGFVGITTFNRIVVNLNYTQNSGHTVSVDLYNYQTSGWDTFTTYSGSPGWYQLALGLIDDVPYISSGEVTVRFNHSSSGNTSHRTWFDYIALESSVQGGQGPRGATGATGATGAQGLTTTTTSTFIFNNFTESTSTNSGAVVTYGGVGIGGNLNVGGVLNVNGLLYIDGNSVGFGYTGSLGDLGYTGSRGYTGSQGDTGYAGSIGDLGYTGSRGYNGSQGDQGTTGFTGSFGYQGYDGSRGYDGSQGYWGSTGYTGSKGDTGTPGDVGYTGSEGIGYTGSASTATGYTGSAGFTGSRGNDGTSVTIIGSTSSYATLPDPYFGNIGDGFITSDNGHLNVWSGSVWNDVGAIIGFTGSHGDVGFTGSTGTQGEVGFTGSEGYWGSVGYTGSEGVGYTGSASTATGYTGSAGIDGYAGSRGESSYTYSVNAPFNPAVGDRWFNTNYGIELVWTDDGDTTQWVEIAASGYLGQVGYTGSQGEQGIDGAYAAVGYTGSASTEVGYTGSQGDLGDQGEKGDIGFTGSQGIKGDVGFIGSFGYTGSQGNRSGLQYSFDPTVNSEEMSDAKIRFNSTVSSVVGEIYISNVDINGADHTNFILSWDDSTNPENKGQLTFKKNFNASTATVVYTITGPITTSTAYLTIPVEYISGSLTGFIVTDHVAVEHSRTGDLGYTGSRGYTGSLGGFSSIQTINLQTGTTYTLELSDAGLLVKLNNAVGTTVTIPTEGTANFAIGQRIDLQQVNTGPVIITAAGGVTLTNTDSPILNSQYSIGTLIKTGTNEWTFVSPMAIGYTGSQGVGYAGSTGFVGSAGAGTNLSASWAYLTAGSTSGTGWQKVPISTVSVDEAAWWNTGGQYFKPVTGGWYLIAGRARTATVSLAALAIGKNGTHFQGLGNDTNASQIAVGGSQIIYLNGTTDYVDLRVFANAGAVAYTTGAFDTYLQITGPLNAGPTGYTGSFGGTGYTGSQGVDGYVGMDGYVGSAGYTGSQGIAGYGTVNLLTRNYTGNSTTTNFTVTTGSTVDSVFVFENGVMQFPTSDYTITGTNLSFLTAPATGVEIQIRELNNGGSTGGGGGATGGGSDQVFYENDQIVTTSYTITSGKSAMSTGPITIATGTVVTITTGSRWVII